HDHMGRGLVAWDAGTGQHLRTLPYCHDDSVAMSPDSTLMVTVNRASNVDASDVWRVTGDKPARLWGLVGKVTDAVFRPRARLATPIRRGDSSVVRVGDVEPGRPPPPAASFPEGIASLSLSSSGERILVTASDPRRTGVQFMQLLDAATGQPLT